MSVYFDGSNDRLWAEGTPPVTSHNPSTIALWFKRTDAYAGGGDVLAMFGQKAGDADVASHYWRAYSNPDGTVAASIKDTISRGVDTANTDTTGNWAHAAVVVSDTGWFMAVSWEPADRWPC